MNHYVSTYRSDYTWPQLSRPRQLSPPRIEKDITCTCAQSRKALEELLQICKESDDRTGRVKRLKLCFTTEDKPKPKPPAVKYPDPCEKFRDERTARVDADRLKTTYQAHFSDPAAALMARRDKPSTIVEKDSQELQYCLPIKITIEPDFHPHCHAHLPSTDKSPRAKTRYVPPEKTSKCRKKQEDDKKIYPAWKSEYQDTVDKIGGFIIKAKLHHSKSNVIPVRITSN